MFLSVRHPDRELDDRANTIAVVVLGMHRSGTSSTAGTLVRLGGAAPRHLVPPSAENERGFWESRVIVDLNDDVLAASGSDWRDCRRFDSRRMDGAAADVLRARAKAALADEFGGTGFPVVKDPRMCRLMPFWVPVFDEAEWSVRAILPIRSPLEVGSSLNRRDDLGLSYSCLLWLRHVLDAEAETRGMARAVLDWPRFLDDRRGTLARAGEQLGIIWPQWCESTHANVDRFLSPNLRRHKSSVDDLRAHPAINDLVRETYAATIELVEDPEDSSILRRLDDLRERFESAAAIFGQPLRELEEEVCRARSQGAAEREEFAARRTELVLQLAAARSERDSLLERITEASERLTEASERLTEANRERARGEAVIAHIANRYAEKNRPSKKPRFRSLWRDRSTVAAPTLVNLNDLEAIRSSVFFDRNYYLEANPDVVAAGWDAAIHYLVHGSLEGRDPGPFFSTRTYLAKRPDLAEAGVNALVHYETHTRERPLATVAGVDRGDDEEVRGG